MADNAQLHVRMPSRLHDALRERAEQQNVSLNTLMVDTLSSAVPTPLCCPLCNGTGNVDLVIVTAHKEALALLATAEGTTAQEGTHEQQQPG